MTHHKQHWKVSSTQLSEVTIMMWANVSAIQIEHGNFSLGYNATLMCTTIIPVDMIEWLDSSGEIVASKKSTGKLILILNSLNTNIHN